MIRVHAAVERNTNSAVERINKFQILKKKFPVSQKLIPGFFKKKNRNRIRPCGLVHTALTVEAVCDMVICDDAVITHELTVRFAEDGSFQYLGNKILNDGIMQIPDYQYRIKE